MDAISPATPQRTIAQPAGLLARHGSLLRAVALYLIGAVSWGLLSAPTLALLEVDPDSTEALRFWGLVALSAMLLPSLLRLQGKGDTIVPDGDIDPAQSLQRRLTEVAARYSTLVDSSPVGIFHFDSDLHLTHFNTRFADILKASADVLEGLDMCSLRDQRVLPAMRAALDGLPGQYDGEYITTHSSRHIHVSLRTAPLHDAEGRVVGGIGIVEDTTARHEAEAMLRESETRYALAMRGTNEGLWDWNPVTHGLFLSSRLLTALGMKSEHLSTNSDEWLARIHSDDRPVFQQRLTEHLKGVTPHFECEYRVLDAEGNYRWVLARGLAQRDWKGRAYRMVGSIGDITDRKRAETALMNMNRELEARVSERTAQLGAALKELETFSYSVSHDLSSPLRAIDGYSALLESEHAAGLDDEARELLKRMRAAVHRMGELIDDLLDLSRVSRQPLVLKQIDLSALAEDILRELREADPARGIITEVEPGIVVEADPGLLRIALHNLLANAWKFTGKTPAPRIRLYRSTTEKNVLCVEDNGAGFDMRYADKLFGAFQRLHTERDFPGTGIGLATVARILQRHGGHIRAHGTPGAGARFEFTLKRS